MSLQFSFNNPTLDDQSNVHPTAIGKIMKNARMLFYPSQDEQTMEIVLAFPFHIWASDAAKSEGKDPIATKEIFINGETDYTVPGEVHIGWVAVFGLTSTIPNFSQQMVVSDAVIHATYVKIATLDDFDGIDLTQAIDLD